MVYRLSVSSTWKTILPRIGVTAICLLCSMPLFAQDEDWLNDDSFWRDTPEPQQNKGELKFLENPPRQTFHHHINRITLDEDSLASGWVDLHQCHRDIDRVSRAQIVYQRAATEDLEILHQKNIDESWVQGASIQLREVREGAELCVRARSQMLSMLEDGRYVLNNGPFMRRFFDGYFPMRVTVEVSWGDLDLHFLHSEPPQQPGFALDVADGQLTLDTLFEGRLRTALFFLNGITPDL